MLISHSLLYWNLAVWTPSLAPFHDLTQPVKYCFVSSFSEYSLRDKLSPHYQEFQMCRGWVSVFPLHTVEPKQAHLGHMLHVKKKNPTKKRVHITQNLAYSRCSKDILGRKEETERERERNRRIKDRKACFQSWLQAEACKIPLGAWGAL